MARRRSASKRKYVKTNSAFQALPTFAVLTLSTLADGVVISTPMTNLTDDFWFQSGDLSVAIDGMTAGQGPLLFGIANGNLSVTEITEQVDAAPQHRADIIPREQARRPVRRLGMLSIVGTNEKWNDGATKRSTIKMYMAEGAELVFWVRNVSGATLTTGGRAIIFGTLFGTWK